MTAATKRKRASAQPDSRDAAAQTRSVEQHEQEEGPTDSLPPPAPLTVYPGSHIELAGLDNDLQAPLQLGQGITMIYPTSEATKTQADNTQNHMTNKSELEQQSPEQDFPSPLVFATRCGLLRQLGNRLHVESRLRRYAAQVGDLVIGIIKSRHIDDYRVDIGSAEFASLPLLAFQGATRRNCPNLLTGTLIYATVEAVSRHSPTVLTCISPHETTDWVAQQSLFGPLQEGQCVNCSLQLCQRLISEDEESCLVLSLLARHIGFEICIGLNGRVWIKSPSPILTVLIANSILNSEMMNASQTRAMVDKLVASIN